MCFLAAGCGEALSGVSARGVRAGHQTDMACVCSVTCNKPRDVVSSNRLNCVAAIVNVVVVITALQPLCRLL